MAVVAGLLARLEAETAGFHARITAASAQVERMGRNGVVAQRGVRLLQGGLQQLAFQATSLPGPLGRVAAGFASIGIGSFAVTGVLAAGGEIALIWRGVTAVITDLEKALVGLNREFATLAGQQAPALGALTQLMGTQGRISNLQEPGFLEQLFSSGRATLAAQGGEGAAGLFTWLFGDVPIAQQTGRAAQIGALENIKRLQEDILARVREEERVRHRILEGTRREEAFLLASGFFTPIGTQPVGGPLFAGKRTLEPEPLFGTKRMDLKFADLQKSLFGIEGVKGGGPPGFKLTPEFALMSSMALLQGAQQGPAGFFGAAAGPIGMINPLAGAITASVGGIFSLFDKSEEKRTDRLIDEFRRMGKEVGRNFRVFIQDSSGNVREIRHELLQLDTTDPQDRAPLPPGFGG